MRQSEKDEQSPPTKLLKDLFEKYNLEWFDILIIHESDIATMLSGCYHDFEKGQILRAFNVSCEMVVNEEHFDREGYFISRYGLINRGFATKDISDYFYKKQIKKAEEELEKTEKARDEAQKDMKRACGNLTAYQRLRNKAKENRARKAKND